MTVDETGLGLSDDPKERVRELAEIVKRNNGDVEDLQINSVIMELSRLNREGMPDDVRTAAAAALKEARDNSERFTAKKILESARRERRRVSNQLARGGMRSKGTVKPPSARRDLHHGGQRGRVPLRS